ncbi:MAG: hypothetical protein Q9183_006695 [Haloplaca sp. 2 TL-2023]
MQDGGPTTPQISAEMRSKYHELLELSQRGPRSTTRGNLRSLSPTKLSRSTKIPGSPSPVRKRPEFSLDESESSPTESGPADVAASNAHSRTSRESPRSGDDEENLKATTDPAVESQLQMESNSTSDTVLASPCAQISAVRSQSTQSRLTPQHQPEHGSEQHDDPFESDKVARPPLIGRSSTMENQRLAEDIIRSATEAEVSPLKCGELLLARTRQSMTFCRKDSLLPDSSPEPRSSNSNETHENQQEQGTMPKRSSSLVERTRRSMSLLPNPSSKTPRNSIHNRRQSRQYPRNQFETPKKRLENVDEVTPPDILFSPDADYASVFKSRPKIATSPDLSPTIVDTVKPSQSEGGGAVDPL